MSEISSPNMPESIFPTSICAIFAGVLVQSGTLGIMAMLLWEYLRQTCADSRPFRAMVSAVWLLCFVALVLNAHALYQYGMSYIQLSQNIDTRLPLARSLCLLIVMTGIVLTVVRLIFLNRVRKLYCAQGKLSWTLIIFLSLTCALSLGDFGGSLLITVKLFEDSGVDAGAFPHLQIPWVLMYGLGISADIILVSTLCTRLHNSRSGLQRTDSVINTLIMYTIQTALFPTLISIISLVLFLAKPETLLYIPFYWQNANLYLWSLFASLRHREHMRQQITRPLTLDLSPFDKIQAPAESTNSWSSTQTSAWLPIPPVPLLSHHGRLTRWDSASSIYSDTILETENEKSLTLKFEVGRRLSLPVYVPLISDDMESNKVEGQDPMDTGFYTRTHE